MGSMGLCSSYYHAADDRRVQCIAAYYARNNSEDLFIYFVMRVLASENYQLTVARPSNIATQLLCYYGAAYGEKKFGLF
jgi:hypothetical protein